MTERRTRRRVDHQGGQVGKRRQILRAAVTVFVRDGFARATLDAVAAEAGVAKQTIYNHFGDKESLVMEVVQAALDPLTSEFTTIAQETLGRLPERDLAGCLTEFGRRWIRLLMCDETAALRHLIVAEAPHYPELNQMLDRVDTALPVIAGHLARVAYQGHLDLDAPDLAARQLRALFIGEAQVLTMFGRVRLDDRQVDDVVRAGVDLFLRAYAPQAAPGRRSPVSRVG